MTPADDVDPPRLCPFCTERLARAVEHGHVDPDWAARAARDLARQCCTRRNP